MGVKSTNQFERYRVNHDVIRDPMRYFNLETLPPFRWQSSTTKSSREKKIYDLTGGGDPTPTRGIGQFDHKKLLQKEAGTGEEPPIGATVTSFTEEQQEVEAQSDDKHQDQSIWLRFEPFILHVCCRTLADARSLVNTARPVFKNVGLTSWRDGKCIVAIWGDEGLDMPLTSPQGSFLYQGMEQWLTDLVNTRHERNWEKIDKFTNAVRNMPLAASDVEGDPMHEHNYIDGEHPQTSNASVSVKSFDIIGDIALLYSLPDGNADQIKEMASAIMAKNKAIKIVAARTSSLSTKHRSTGESGIVILAGPNRSPLITTHTEYGIKCQIDLQHVFFSPRMAQERLRICQQVARGERVLVLFSGVGMEALQLAGRTEAKEVIAIENNPVAAECARRAAGILARNKRVPCLGAAERLHLMEGDVMDIMPTFETNSFDRILAPRPKEGKLDGDLGEGDAGVPFLELLILLLRSDGGECHWYDFCADHEMPDCARTRTTIQDVCDRLGYQMEVINVANVGSVAKRQLRVCMDFRIIGRK